MKVEINLGKIDMWPNKLRNIFRNFKELIRIKKWKKQRVQQGFCDFDVWNFGDFIAEVIPNGLRALADVTNCYPVDFDSLESWQDFIRKMAEDIESINYDPIEEALEIYSMAIEALKQPEIIRCKECKFYDGFIV